VQLRMVHRPWSGIALVLAVGCADPAGGKARVGGDSAGPTDTAADEVCALAPPEVATLAVPTVIEGRWAPAAGGPATWALVARDDRGRELRSRDGDDAQRVLVGFAERSALQVRVEAGGGCSPWVELETGALDPGLPVARRLDAGGPTDGFVLATLLSPGSSWVVAFDEEGAMVFGAEVLADDPDLNPIAFRARPSPDGRGITVNLQPVRADGAGALITVGWDGEELERIAINGAHTDFVFTPDGGVGALGWEVLELEGRRLLADTLLERSPEGVVRVVWRVSQDYTPDLSRVWPPGFLTGDPEVEDWSHGNGLGHDPDTGTWYMSLPFLHGVAAIDAATGLRRWTLAPEAGELDVIGDPETIWAPHSVQPVDGGLVMFQRRDPTDLSTCSRAAAYAIDPEAATATLSWTYEGQTCHQEGFLGNVEPLPDGGLLVGWSQFGELERLDAARSPALLLALDVGAAFGFTTYAPTLADLAAAP